MIQEGLSMVSYLSYYIMPYTSTEIVLNCLTDRQALKGTPKILSGGYKSWNYFVAQSQDLINSDWVEIGEGNGIRPFEKVSQPPPKSYSSSSSPHASRNNIVSSQYFNSFAGNNGYDANHGSHIGNNNMGNIQKSPSNNSVKSLQSQSYGKNGSQELFQTGASSGFPSNLVGNNTMNNSLGLLQSNQVKNNYGLGLNSSQNYTMNTQSHMNGFNQHKPSQVYVNYYGIVNTFCRDKVTMQISDGKILRG